MIPSGEFNPGFRLSTIDVVILICGILGTTMMGQREWWLGLVVSFVVGHYHAWASAWCNDCAGNIRPRQESRALQGTRNILPDTGSRASEPLASPLTSSSR